ncbi:MAG: DUF423 domain-containing protein, partial [Rickettsiales bacterium]|nr:DUF423 domain-containing protein [Rickettsiales bacterium]
TSPSPTPSRSKISSVRLAKQMARLAFAAGVVLFCGSLYAKGFALLGAAPLAPAGGMLLMLGWLLLCFAREPD